MMMMLSTGHNESSTNVSAAVWDDLDSLWPDQTPFDVVWYGALLVVLYSVVFTASVVGESVNLSLSLSLTIYLSIYLSLVCT